MVTSVQENTHCRWIAKFSIFLILSFVWFVYIEEMWNGEPTPADSRISWKITLRTEGSWCALFSHFINFFTYTGLDNSAYISRISAKMWRFRLLTPFKKMQCHWMIICECHNTLHEGFTFIFLFTSWVSKSLNFNISLTLFYFLLSNYVGNVKWRLMRGVFQRLL